MRALLVVLALVATVHAEPRLPRSFTPTAYRLRIEVGKQLVGHVEIDGVVTAQVDTIWLDYRGTVRSPSVEKRGDLVGIRGPFAPGPRTLALDFTSNVDEEGVVPLPADGAPRDPLPEEVAAARNKAMGAFRQIVEGHPYLYTQSERDAARQIFPCIDEPAYKVPWTLTLDVPADLVAASNAPIARQQTANGRRVVEFETTRPLPSYLLAFAVGPFDVQDAGKGLRILGIKGRTYPYAKEMAHKILELTAAWTGVPYAYPKLDLVAIPRTGLWAAMENPGLVTFADWALRPDLGPEHRKLAFLIIAHEFAHQWFGDLVTMAWWNDIWLNESFAVWVSAQIMATYEPKWVDDGEHQGISETARPLAGDESYERYFDGIRGARTIRELVAWLGPEEFRKRIHGYLVAHADGTATTEDLAQALDLAPQALIASLDSPTPAKVGVTTTCDRITANAQPQAIMCVAYEQGGKREQACGFGAALQIELKRCPRWVIPNAGGAMQYASPRTRRELRATASDWAILTGGDRRALLDEVGTDVALAGRLVDAPDAKAWSADVLAKTVALAPDRTRAEAWLAKKYVARAAKLQLRSASAEDSAVIAAASQTGDPGLAKLALAQFKAGLAIVDTDVLGAVVRLALRADPSLEPIALDELNRAFFGRRQQLLGALRPDVQGLQLTSADRMILLANTCDPARRGEAQKIASELSDGANWILRAYNACLDERDASRAAWATLAK